MAFNVKNLHLNIILGIVTMEVKEKQKQNITVKVGEGILE